MGWGEVGSSQGRRRVDRGIHMACKQPKPAAAESIEAQGVQASRPLAPSRSFLSSTYIRSLSNAPCRGGTRASPSRCRARGPCTHLWAGVAGVSDRWGWSERAPVAVQIVLEWDGGGGSDCFRLDSIEAGHLKPIGPHNHSITYRAGAAARSAWLAWVGVWGVVVVLYVWCVRGEGK